MMAAISGHGTSFAATIGKHQWGANDTFGWMSKECGKDMIWGKGENLRSFMQWPGFTPFTIWCSFGLFVNYFCWYHRVSIGREILMLPQSNLDVKKSYKAWSNFLVRSAVTWWPPNVPFNLNFSVISWFFKLPSGCSNSLYWLSRKLRRNTFL